MGVSMMEEEVNAPACGQVNDLIGFLYGELSDDQAQTFQRHMDGCISCSGEHATFSGIRRSLVAWRDESLGGISSGTAVPNAAALEVRKASALAALREFFNLSPLWMKGAVAFATLLFCIFAGLAVARLRATPPAPMAGTTDRPDKVNTKEYSDQQLNALVERRVQDELQRIKNSAPPPTPPLVVDNQSSRILNRRIATGRNQVAANSPARRPLSKAEREQLAADLRLVAINSDGELELLDDKINQ